MNTENNKAALLGRISRLAGEADWTAEELKEALREENVDPDQFVKNVRKRLSPLLTNRERAGEADNRNSEEARGFPGILAAAKQKGLSSAQLAATTGLSVVLVTMLDRGLISLGRLPKVIIERLAQALDATTRQVTDYLLIGPRLAPDASYKAEDTPELPEPQDFFEAVRNDPALPPEYRQQLLSLEGNAE
ncbi:MAG TPA: hypothetical protein VFD58_08270 [Blastocatellia bacterium]|nr:hypothetical protein [Blastocatellia bacterium]